MQKGFGDRNICESGPVTEVVISQSRDIYMCEFNVPPALFAYTKDNLLRFSIKIARKFMSLVN